MIIFDPHHPIPFNRAVIQCEGIIGKYHAPDCLTYSYEPPYPLRWNRSRVWNGWEHTDALDLSGPCGDAHRHRQYDRWTPFHSEGNNSVANYKLGLRVRYYNAVSATTERHLLVIIRNGRTRQSPRLRWTAAHVCTMIQILVDEHRRQPLSDHGHGLLLRHYQTAAMLAIPTEDLPKLPA